MIERVNDVAPNFKGSITHRQIIGPKQMQDEWGLIGGNIFHGELTVDQLFHMRPAPGYADYRTPIAGLYQASSATHAGGGVTGMPGHHCVREILKDKASRSGSGRRGARGTMPPWRGSPRRGGVGSTGPNACWKAPASTVNGAVHWYIVLPTARIIGTKTPATRTIPFDTAVGLGDVPAASAAAAMNAPPVVGGAAGRIQTRPSACSCSPSDASARPMSGR